MTDHDELLAIVSGLAARDPYEPDRGHDFCRICDGVDSHADGCLWVRAREAVAGSATPTEPVAWTSEDGIHNLRTKRERGHSHDTIQVRVDRPDDYNTVPLVAGSATPGGDDHG
jgi:hypothetical protein